MQKRRYDSLTELKPRCQCLDKRPKHTQGGKKKKGETKNIGRENPRMMARTRKYDFFVLVEQQFFRGGGKWLEPTMPHAD